MTFRRIQLRWSFRALFLTTALIAAGLAIPARVIIQIRAESNAANAIQAGINCDKRALKQESSGIGEVQRTAQTGFRRVLYRLADSPGTVRSLCIIGDHSARALADNALALRNLEYLEMCVRAPPKIIEGTVTQLHIDSMAHCRKPLVDVVIRGPIDCDVSLSPLSGIPSIERLRIEASDLPSGVIHSLGVLQVESLHLSNEGQVSGWQPFPSYALSSFNDSPVRNIRINAAIDDRAIELIATAPCLKSLDISILSGFASDPPPQKITAEGLRRACRLLHVETLHIEADYEIHSDECIAEITAIRELRNLKLPGLSLHGIRLIKSLRPDIDVN